VGTTNIQRSPAPPRGCCSYATVMVNKVIHRLSTTVHPYSEVIHRLSTGNIVHICVYAYIAM
jgi:hypothetical protein